MLKRTDFFSINSNSDEIVSFKLRGKGQDVSRGPEKLFVFAMRTHLPYHVDSSFRRKSQHSFQGGRSSPPPPPRPSFHGVCITGFTSFLGVVSGDNHVFAFLLAVEKMMNNGTVSRGEWQLFTQLPSNTQAELALDNDSPNWISKQVRKL